MQSMRPSAELELPSELHGGDLKGLFGSLGLSASRIAGNRWSIHAATPAGRHYELITSRTLSGARLRVPQFDILTKFLDVLPHYRRSPTVEAQMQQLRSAAGNPDADLVTRLRHFQAELMLVDVGDSAALAERCFDLLGLAVRENTEIPLFPDRSAHLISTSEVLRLRVKLPSILLRLAQDPQLINELRTGTVNVEQDGLTFQSAEEQIRSLVLSGSFLGPLMGSLLPCMWGFPISRPQSAIVFGFGRAVPSVTSMSRGMLQLLPETGQSVDPGRPQFAPVATREAVDWWVLRLNQLFTYLTDPATFVDSGGLYAPHEQQHWMLTVDQILRLTTSLQMSVRDPVGQRATAFTLLGSFSDRLLGSKVNLKKLFTLAYAREQFEFVKRSMPAPASEILLPAAQRALDALEEVQAGFFIAHQRNARTVTIHQADGQAKTINLQDAAARLMVLHRNATHGYGGLRTSEDKRIAAELEERLLAQHNGKIPNDIALLPYLYLLVAMSDPDTVRGRIADHVGSL
ncbi:hypothetical protein [Rhodococcus sp. AQ5-07]|uniref:hypothetical protein n=2 Tax=Rhodococcus TaxID=1827 RepID=UPI0012B60B94|nr:hypothetical protein [Rhodococcus sp. AQ5-07]